MDCRDAWDCVCNPLNAKYIWVYLVKWYSTYYVLSSILPFLVIFGTRSQIHNWMYWIAAINCWVYPTQFSLFLCDIRTVYHCSVLWIYYIYSHFLAYINSPLLFLLYFIWILPRTLFTLRIKSPLSPSHFHIRYMFLFSPLTPKTYYIISCRHNVICLQRYHYNN